MKPYFSPRSSGMVAMFAYRGLVVWFITALWGCAALAATPQTPPFILSWTHGDCPNCQTAKSLNEVQFVSTKEAWAIGYNPPGETGAGDYSVLHTSDSGETWRELPWTYVHNDWPRISFANRREGWIMVYDMSEAEQRLLQTRDGGGHWRRVSLRSPFVSGIQYLGRGAGFAYSFDIYSKRGYLFRTVDYGRSWRKARLPGEFNPARIAFVDDKHGVLAGCQGQTVTTLRTSDAGRRWTETQIDTPATSKTMQGCAYEVDDINLSKNGRGWLVINKRSFANGDTEGFEAALRTSDGGATWTPALKDAPQYSQVAFSSFTSAHFIGSQLNIITKSFLSSDRGELVYAANEGWNHIELAYGVAGCKGYSTSLTCAAGEQGFWVLQIIGNE